MFFVKETEEYFMYINNSFPKFENVLKHKPIEVYLTSQNVFDGKKADKLKT